MGATGSLRRFCLGTATRETEEGKSEERRTEGARDHGRSVCGGGPPFQTLHHKTKEAPSAKRRSSLYFPMI